MKITHGPDYTISLAFSEIEQQIIERAAVNKAYVYAQVAQAITPALQELLRRFDRQGIQAEGARVAAALRAAGYQLTRTEPEEE